MQSGGYETQRMLASFASVGTHRFDGTFFHIDGHMRNLRKDRV
jgi:hypothetical protein